MNRNSQIISRILRVLPSIALASLLLAGCKDANLGTSKLASDSKATVTGIVQITVEMDFGLGSGVIRKMLTTDETIELVTSPLTSFSGVSVTSSGVGWIPGGTYRVSGYLREKVPQGPPTVIIIGNSDDHKERPYRYFEAFEIQYIPKS